MIALAPWQALLDGLGWVVAEIYELIPNYGVTIILIGLLTFMFTGWFGKPAAKKQDPDAVFDVSDHHEGRQPGGRS